MPETTIVGNHAKRITADAIDFYKNYWHPGDNATQADQQRDLWILSKLFPQGLHGKTVMEIGLGGAGGLIRYLQKENKIFGLDASEAALRNCERMGIPAKLHNADREMLPFNDGTVDLVFAMEVFEHFAAPQYVLEEIRRVLKPSGIVVASTPHTLVHHWPRLFYPDLFERDAFREFLMINDFKVILEEGFGANLYPHDYLPDAKVRWSFLWQGRKMTDGDAQVYMAHGLYFWGKKNDRGIRTRPMEAIDCFRKSWELSPDNITARFMLARSLVYRFIYGEEQEFAKHYDFLTQTMMSGKQPMNLQAHYHWAMMYLEMERLGRQRMRRADFESVLKMLSQHPEGQKLQEQVINRWRTFSPIS